MVEDSDDVLFTGVASTQLLSGVVCPDVVLGNYPNPSISSKWGIPIYEYYSRSEVDGQYVYTKIDDESYVNNEGIYYAKAYVPGTSNYDLIDLLK